MTFVAALIIALAVSMTYGEYKKKREARLLCEEEMLHLLTHFKKEIICFCRPTLDALLDFQPKSGLVRDFLMRTREGEGMRCAFINAEKSHPVSKKAREIITRYLEGVGKEYLASEIERVADAEKEFSEYFAIEAAECERSLQIYKALALAISLGIILLVI